MAAAGSGHDVMGISRVRPGQGRGGGTHLLVRRMQLVFEELDVGVRWCAGTSWISDGSSPS